MKVLKNLHYTRDHEWIKILGGGKAMIGITDHAQKELGDIVYVELPEVEDEFDAEESFGTVESVKAASDLYMPVGGSIIAANEELEDAPELLNQDPYENWIIQIQISDESQLEGLMSGEEYEKYCAEEE